MRFEEDLQVALRNRLRKLMTATIVNFSHEVRLVCKWISSQPLLMSVLTEAARAEPEVDTEQWINSTGGAMGAWHWPSETDPGRAYAIWKLMNHIGDGGVVNPDYGWRIAYTFVRGDGAVRTFSQDVLSPLFDYLEEEVGKVSSVLFALQRYVRHVEWFDRDELYERYRANQSTGEEVYNLDLQKFLFVHHNIVTHAKARSASGEPDLVGFDSAEILVCDGKLFDGSSRGKPYLAKGANQIVQYAQDYHQPEGFMMIFNMTDRALELPTEDPDGGWPAHITISGVRVYLVVIRAKVPDVTASKLGKSDPVRMVREDFFKNS